MFFEKYYEPNSKKKEGERGKNKSIAYLAQGYASFSQLFLYINIQFLKHIHKILQLNILHRDF